MGFKTLAKAVGKGICNHATAITTTVAVVGYAATVITAIRETRTFDARIEELKIDKNGEDLTKKEVAKVAVKTYLPSILIFTGTTITLVAGNVTMLKKYNDVSAACNTASATLALREKAFKEYKEAVKKTVSEQNRQEIEEKADKIKAKSTNVSSVREVAEHVERCNGREELYMDRITGRLFFSTPSKIKDGMTEANNKLMREGEISYGDILTAWGLNDYGYSSFINELAYRYDIEGDILHLRKTRAETDDEYTITVVGPVEEPRFHYS